MALQIMENPLIQKPLKSQMVRIKDPIPILTFQVQCILTNVFINICMYTPLQQSNLSKYDKGAGYRYWPNSSHDPM